MEDFTKGLVVFSGKDCPKCEELKNVLKQKQKVYTEFDIWNNPEALKFIMSKGYRSIPQLFLEGEKIEEI